MIQNATQKKIELLQCIEEKQKEITDHKKIIQKLQEEVKEMHKELANVLKGTVGVLMKKVPKSIILEFFKYAFLFLIQFLILFIFIILN